MEVYKEIKSDSIKKKKKHKKDPKFMNLSYNVLIVITFFKTLNS